MISFLFLLLPFAHSQWISQPHLDCRRVHPSFCCTSRIRTVCPLECSQVPCGPEYYQQLFSTDLNAGSSSRIRDMSTGKTEDRAEFAVVDVTAPPPMFSTTKIPVSTIFPTLIPFEPSIDEVPKQEKDIMWSTPPPQPQKIPFSNKKNRTPDPRIIRPPDGSLVLIGDYEDGEQNQGPVISNSGAVTVPSTFIEKQENSQPASVLSRSVPSGFEETKENSESSFTGALVKNPANGAIDGIAGRKKDIANSISALLSQFKITPSETKTAELRSGSASVSGRQLLPSRPETVTSRPETALQPWQATPAPWQRTSSFWQTTPFTQAPVTSALWQGQTNAHWQAQNPASWQTPSPWGPGQTTPAPWQATQTPPPPQPWQTPTPPLPQVQCGVSPHFTPCVSAQEASSKLLACCRQKNLPVGCQSLCRYDITQAEVRAALDRGQCGLLHVSPFLECAAQGKDNSECCSVRGVAQKTGPQCIQFCRPGMGLTGLGLQHVVCGNAIGDMLYCHHSGIR